MFDRFRLLTIVILFVIPVPNAQSGEETLRLVPYPKQVESCEGTFPLDQKLLLEVSADEADVLGPMIGRELARAGLPVPETRPARDARHLLRLSVGSGDGRQEFANAVDIPSEGYVLDVRPYQVVCRAESKSYALDWTMKRYKKAVRRFDDLAKRLEDARKATAGKPLPELEAVGLALP